MIMIGQNVVIIDDVISLEQQEAIKNLLLIRNTCSWHFFLDKGNLITPGLVTTIYEAIGTPYTDTKYFDDIKFILDSACKRADLKIDQLIQIRPFIQLPVVEKFRTAHNNIHRDQNFPHVVCVYYATDSDGDTLIFDDDTSTVVERISPKQGRAVFFDGLRYHASSCPKEHLRVIINFNFTI
jgi:hypothetical protein